MLLKKRDKIQRLDYYFAGYDSSSPDFCIWVPSRAAAISIKSRNVVDKLVNYLYVNYKLNTKIFSLEVIDGQHLEKVVS